MLPYIYAPLGPGEIRVFIFDRIDGEETPNDPLSRTLRITKLEHAAQGLSTSLFQALSYAWGDLSAGTQQVLCNGKEIRIRKSLKDALLHLRQLPCSQRHFAMPIWADALSINQVDDAEKFVQIQLMADIFRNAEKVWVWLGREMEGIGVAVASLPMITKPGKQIKHLITAKENGQTLGQLSARRQGLISDLFAYTGVPLLEDTLPEFPTHPEQIGLPPATSAIWTALNLLLRAPWFKRLWVIQEDVLAKEVDFLCGTHIIKWALLTRLIDHASPSIIKSIEALRPVVAYDAPDLSDLSLYREDYTKGITAEVWSVILSTTIMTKFCQEPQDRVLAVLGLMSAETRNKLNFKANTSLAELYSSFFLVVLEGSKQLHVLSSATHDGKPAYIASWCPYFHHYTGIGPGPFDIFNTFAGKNIYEAGLKVESTVHAGLTSLELVLSGYAVDQFATMVAGQWTRSFPSNYLSQSDSRHSLEWLVACEDLFRARAAPNLMQDAETSTKCPDVPQCFWKTLIADDIVFDPTYLEHLRFTTADYEQVVDLMVAIADNAGFNGSSLNTAVHFLSRMDHYLVDHIKRTFFMTRDGRPGLCPPKAQAGDTICIFHGANTPYIIRPGPREGTYILIGEAYVHGIMYGEVEEMGLESEVFVLV